eukprot:jgi/Chlat1/8342/Chrsp8S08097
MLFPRTELFLLMLGLMGVTQASVIIIRGGTAGGAIAGVVALVLYPVAFLALIARCSCGVRCFTATARSSYLRRRTTMTTTARATPPCTSGSCAHSGEADWAVVEGGGKKNNSNDDEKFVNRYGILFADFIGPVCIEEKSAVNGLVETQQAQVHQQEDSKCTHTVEMCLSTPTASQPNNIKGDSINDDDDEYTHSHRAMHPIDSSSDQDESKSDEGKHTKKHESDSSSTVVDMQDAMSLNADPTSFSYAPKATQAGGSAFKPAPMLPQANMAADNMITVQIKNQTRVEYHYARTFYIALDLVKRIITGVLMGAYGNSQQGWSQLGFLLSFTTFQWCYLITLKPFIDRVTQAVETLSMACDLGTFPCAALLLLSSSSKVAIDENRVGTAMLALQGASLTIQILAMWYALWKQLAEMVPALLAKARENRRVRTVMDILAPRALKRYMDKERIMMAKCSQAFTPAGRAATAAAMPNPRRDQVAPHATKEHVEATSEEKHEQQHEVREHATTMLLPTLSVSQDVSSPVVAAAPSPRAPAQLHPTTTTVAGDNTAAIATMEEPSPSTFKLRSDSEEVLPDFINIEFTMEQQEENEDDHVLDDDDIGKGSMQSVIPTR